MTEQGSNATHVLIPSSLTIPPLFPATIFWFATVQCEIGSFMQVPFVTSALFAGRDGRVVWLMRSGISQRRSGNSGAPRFVHCMASTVPVKVVQNKTRRFARFFLFVAPPGQCSSSRGRGWLGRRVGIFSRRFL